MWVILHYRFWVKHMPFVCMVKFKFKFHYYYYYYSLRVFPLNMVFSWGLVTASLLIVTSCHNCLKIFLVVSYLKRYKYFNLVSLCSLICRLLLCRGIRTLPPTSILVKSIKWWGSTPRALGECRVPLNCHDSTDLVQ